MTGPVEEVRYCPWERQTLPVDHDCVADARIPCENRANDGRVCGICPACIAAQEADPRYAPDQEDGS